MKLRSILAITVLCVLATGCTDDEIICTLPPDAGTDGHYFVLIGGDMGSRTSYNGAQSTFDGREDVGMFVLDASGNAVPGQPENAHFRVKNIDNIANPERGRQVLEAVSEADEVAKGCAAYLVYHPYREGLTLAEARNLAFSVDREQDTHEQYEASDLLWDVAVPGGDCVNIAFDHAMARIFVEVDPKSLDQDKGIQALGLALSASGIDLTTDGIDDMHYDTDPPQEFGLSMNFVNVVGSGRYMYGALVPAQTLKSLQPILRLTTPDGVVKEYKMPDTGDMELRPGYSYTISLRSNQDVIVDADDEDSWVFDVRDPVTGEVVGMLCREYIRFQPQATLQGVENDNFNTCDYVTGYPQSVNGEETKAISSQAWVFYDLKKGHEHEGVPDLDRGTVLKFIYDLRYVMNQEGMDRDYISAGRKGSEAAWPAPHRFYNDGLMVKVRGLFMARHGHDWVFNPDKQCGESGPDVFENYMHGGRLEWSTLNSGAIRYNGIKMFHMPERQITNAVANEWGHIAHDPVTGEVYVSYEPYDSETMVDAQEKRVCFIDPVFITDVRVNRETGEQEVLTYPLVKIGYNNFWAKKGMRTKLLNDGTPIRCMSAPGGKFAFDVNAGGDIGYGYMYPNQAKYSVYDHPELHDGFGKLYNYSVVQSDKIVTRNVDHRFTCVLPSPIRFYETSAYCGWMFINKFLTDKIQTKLNDGTNLEPDDVALSENKQLGTATSDMFTCNATGFDLRSLGISMWTGIGDDKQHWSWNDGDKEAFGNSTYFWLSASNDHITAYDSKSLGWKKTDLVFMQFQPWSSWTGLPLNNIASPTSNKPTANYDDAWYAPHKTKSFVGVREVMKLSYQNGPNPHESGRGRSVASSGEGRATTNNASVKKCPERSYCIILKQ